MLRSQIYQARWQAEKATGHPPNAIQHRGNIKSESKQHQSKNADVILDALAPFSMRWRHSRCAVVILDLLTPFLMRFHPSGTFIRMILRKFCRRRVIDLETATFIDSEIDSNTNLFIHLRVHSLIHSDSYMHSYMHSYVHSYYRFYTYSYMHSHVYSNMHSYMNSPFIHATFICSLTRHSFILLYSSLLQKEHWFSRVPIYTLVS